MAYSEHYIGAYIDTAMAICQHCIGVVSTVVHPSAWMLLELAVSFRFVTFRGIYNAFLAGYGLHVRFHDA